MFSKPNNSIKGHIQGGHKFTFFNENVFASRGAPDNQTKVYNSHTQRVRLIIKETERDRERYRYRDRDKDRDGDSMTIK